MDYGRRPLADRQVFRRRLIGTGRIGLGLIVLSLAIGIAGYAITEDLSFVDAFLNASMILSGMGPLHEPKTLAGKIFAGCYALYSGFAVLGIAAIVFSPVIHRLFHRFHIADTDDDPKT
ncbi:MAG TPA: hypothetical protein VHQ02_03020 [Usitatibacter sp.]|jgi:hypothetical protein|nr:hypothetical protein [Usitatibacter sp.]